MLGKTNTGGGALTLRVVGGTTAPANPQEGTIWIKTANPITSWAASATAPGSPVNGMVWLAEGSVSNAPQNVLRRGTLMIYPNAAYQYSSGVWTACEAMSYLSGAWVPWLYVLYKDGDENATLTGGWAASSRAESSDSAAYTDTPTLTRNASNLVMTPSGAQNYGRVAMQIVTPVDFTAMRSLTMQYDTSGSYNDSASVLSVISPSTQYWGAGSAAASAALGSAGTNKSITIDVSALTGSYLVVIGLRLTGTTNVSVTLKSLIAEP